MIDYRIYTFLSLCETMNYRKTSEKLNISQPAVTQHIHALEQEYNEKLFYYAGRVLHKTKAAEQLEEYSKTMLFYENELRTSLKGKNEIMLRIGATKTIGEFVLEKPLIQYLSEPTHNLQFVIDNTQVLLAMLERNQLDFAIVEGFFEKKKYGYATYSLYREEPFLGVCSVNHPFAGKDVPYPDILEQTLILRENGSGTRAIFEQMLAVNNNTVDDIKKVICINSFAVIKQLVAAGMGITFAYEAVANSDSRLTTFTVQNNHRKKEFNYVYLKNTDADKKIRLFEGTAEPGKL